VSKKVVAVTSSQLLTEGLRGLLSEPPLEFCGSVVSFSDIQVFEPRVVMIDFGDPSFKDMNAWLAPRSNVAKPGHTCSLVVEFSESAEVACQLIGKGVCGVVERDAPLEEIKRAVMTTLQGRLWVSQRNMDKFLRQMLHNGNGKRPEKTSELSGLTHRESEILSLLIRLPDRPLRVLAKDHLFCSESTLRNTLSAMYAKLGVNSRAGLVHKSLMLGFKVQLGRGG
jgi:DNA-binding NarL/FixJ family response regulator